MSATLKFDPARLEVLRNLKTQAYATLRQVGDDLKQLRAAVDRYQRDEHDAKSAAQSYSGWREERRAEFSAAVDQARRKTEQARAALRPVENVHAMHQQCAQEVGHLFSRCEAFLSDIAAKPAKDDQAARSMITVSHRTADGKQKSNVEISAEAARQFFEDGGDV